MKQPNTAGSKQKKSIKTVLSTLRWCPSSSPMPQRHKVPLPNVHQGPNHNASVQKAYSHVAPNQTQSIPAIYEFDWTLGTIFSPGCYLLFVSQKPLPCLSHPTVLTPPFSASLRTIHSCIRSKGETWALHNWSEKCWIKLQYVYFIF